MKRTSVFAIALATVLVATAASAERPEDLQAPRGQDLQAPRDRQDEIQAPRGHAESQAPRGGAVPTAQR
jgi:hypothetical protein